MVFFGNVGAWCYVVGVYLENSLKIYVDGSLKMIISGVFVQLEFSGGLLLGLMYCFGWGGFGLEFFYGDMYVMCFYCIVLMEV